MNVFAKLLQTVRISNSDSFSTTIPLVTKYTNSVNSFQGIIMYYVVCLIVYLFIMCSLTSEHFLLDFKYVSPMYPLLANVFTYNNSLLEYIIIS